MAPSLEAVSQPALSEKHLWDGKSLAVAVPAEADIQIPPSSSANYVQPKPVAKFELEEHPIDVVQELRVSPFFYLQDGN